MAVIIPICNAFELYLTVALCHLQDLKGGVGTPTNKQ